MSITVEEYAERFALDRETKSCNDCGAGLRKAAPLCGMCDAEDLEGIVRDLAAPRPANALAVWELRDRGLTARQVLAVRREVLTGRPVYEIVKAIEGLSNRGAGE